MIVAIRCFSDPFKEIKIKICYFFFLYKMTKFLKQTLLPAIRNRTRLLTTEKAPKSSFTQNDFKKMTVKSIAAFFAAGSGLFAYYYYERNRLKNLKESQNEQGYGKPKVGGPFRFFLYDE